MSFCIRFGCRHCCVGGRLDNRSHIGRCGRRSLGHSIHRGRRIRTQRCRRPARARHAISNETRRLCHGRRHSHLVELVFASSSSSYSVSSRRHCRRHRVQPRKRLQRQARANVRQGIGVSGPCKSDVRELSPHEEREQKHRRRPTAPLRMRPSRPVHEYLLSVYLSICLSVYLPTYISFELSLSLSR